VGAPSALFPIDPLDDDGFDRLMAAFEPFESAPHVAVAVSGGSDSLALAHLAAAWAARRGGAVTAITVDHGLRPASADEAGRVAAWMAAAGIGHVVLGWRGPKPATGLQAAARAMRYALLEGWCRRAGVLHLLLGHQRDDQIETVRMRADRGSGPLGRAGMSAVRETAGLRLLRPLLGVPRARLRATLTARGREWIDDPSNDDIRFARARLRRTPGLLAAGDPAVLGAARVASERAAAALLAGAARLHPAGFATVDPHALLAGGPEVGRHALAALVATLGGREHFPRSVRVARAWAALAGGPLRAGITLGGCRILPRAGGLLVCRETGRITDEAEVHAGVRAIWDGRFAISVAGPPGARAVLRRLGEDGWRRLCENVRAAAPVIAGLPAPVRPALPALWAGGEPVALPHLGCGRGTANIDSLRFDSLAFAPSRPLTGGGFMLV